MQNPQYTNYALTARSTEATINDGNYDTVGSTEEGKPRVFVLQFAEPIRLHTIRIRNYNLFRFQLDAWDSRNLRWQTFQAVRQRRDATGERRVAQPGYEFSKLKVTTDKLRLVVSRTVDDEVQPKAEIRPGDKVVNIKPSSVYPRGYYYRVLIEAPAQIREIEVFGNPVD